MKRRRNLGAVAWVPSMVWALLAGGCGGGGTLDNAPTIVNGPLAAGQQKLSFAYFQRCVFPVLTTPIPSPAGGTSNTCASGGCHDNVTGTGGALRLVGGATPVDLTLDAATIRATDMYKNYYSAMGETVIGQPEQSRLVDKPLVRGVLHGGGIVFASATDPRVLVLEYWISHPMPQGQDEFSAAGAALFAPPDPVAGACNTP
ncbi:MAG: hypothetical protein KGN16_02425 [Burkholderiales bacterium]|nr:hypothetical protein [Burkholderiales bacterium]